MLGPVLAFIERVKKEAPEYATFITLLAVKVVAHMPNPDVIRKWLGAMAELPPTAAIWRRAGQKVLDLIFILYDWLYNALQAFISASRGDRKDEKP